MYVLEYVLDPLWFGVNYASIILAINIIGWQRHWALSEMEILPVASAMIYYSDTIMKLRGQQPSKIAHKI